MNHCYLKLKSVQCVDSLNFARAASLKKNDAPNYNAKEI